MWIAGFVIFALGLILVIVAPINKKKNARCSAKTQGMLRDVWEKEDADGPTGNMYVYTYNVDGIEYETRSTIRSKQAGRIGDICTIWYDPARPEQAQPFHYDSNKIYNIILVIGIVMVPIGIILILFDFVQ